jgi:hypothetical protein
MARGSIDRLCTIHDLDVLQLNDHQTPSGAHVKTWDQIRSIKGRVIPQNGQVLVALMQAQNRAFYLIYFSSDPQLNSLTNRLVWRGQILRLLSPPLDAHGLGRIWTANAAYFSEDQPARLP